jgi:hypothetical protein
MSARPGRVKAIVDIRLDRTELGLVKDKRFSEKVDEIWDLVSAEAIIAQRARPQ